MGTATLIVIDTHALIWFVEGMNDLGRQARQRIADEAAMEAILIPAIVPWEVAQLVKRSRAFITRPPSAWFGAVLAKSAFRIAPLELDIAIATAELDWTHRDPMDRFIVATARHHDADVVTADHAILRYAAAGHVRAIDASQ